MVSGGKRIELKDGHGNDTNCSFNIKSGELKFSADGKTLIGPGSATIEMDWNDDPETAGVAVEKIRVAGQTWTQTGEVGRETHVVTIDPPPPKLKVESTTSQNLETHKVFNTIDYIDKANRQLWRTNVYGRGGFVNQYGVCPFDTKLSLEDNPYAGSHRIVWNNITFPINGNYDIGVEVDDNVTLTIIGGGKEEVIKKRGFAGGVDIGGERGASRGGIGGNNISAGSLSGDGSFGSAFVSGTLYPGDTQATGNNGGQTIACTKGVYWAQQGKGACDDIGTGKFRQSDGTIVTNTVSGITRGYKAGYNIIQTGGVSLTSNGGNGGCGVAGGSGTQNGSGGGGGGSGYHDGSVTVVDTRLGGSTGDGKVVLRLQT